MRTTKNKIKAIIDWINDIENLSKKRKEMSVIMTIIKSDSGYFMSIQEICSDA